MTTYLKGVSYITTRQLLLIDHSKTLLKLELEKVTSLNGILRVGLGSVSLEKQLIILLCHFLRPFLRVLSCFFKVSCLGSSGCCLVDLLNIFKVRIRRNQHFCFLSVSILVRGSALSPLTTLQHKITTTQHEWDLHSFIFNCSSEKKNSITFYRVK